MENKNNKYFYIVVAVLSIGYIAFGLFMALTNEFEESRNYLKKKEETKPITGEGKGVIVTNESLNTIDEVKTKCRCQGN